MELMMSKYEPKSTWDFLNEYKGKIFNGEWPTLPELLRISTERYPDKAFFTEFIPERNTLSYKQVLDNVNKLANWMVGAGIRKGDKVAVSGKNSPEWATVYLATLEAGGVIVPIDYGLHEKETENLLKASSSRLFFVDSEKYEYFTKNKPLGVKILSLSKKYEETYAYNLFSSLEHKKAVAEENDLAAILYTSGTTGNPKGVMLTHKNLVADSFIAQTRMNLYPSDVFYALLPIHHSYTMQAVFICSLSSCAEIVFAKSMAVSKMLKELKEGKVTMLLGVPLLFNKLLSGILKGIKEKGTFVYVLIRILLAISYFFKKVFGLNIGKVLFKGILEKASLGSLRIAICGGGPLASSIFKVYNSMGIDFVQGYGLTETSPIIALNPKEHFKIKSVGQFFMPWMEMRIASPDSKGIGEVEVKGPMVMQGYYNMPEETASVFTTDGWFKTGDLGKLDDEGYLYLAGRAKNLIVTEGGKNVFPEEIENAFQLYTEIEQITVVGYIQDASTKSEAIEALVYPSDELFKKLSLERNSNEGIEKSTEIINDIVGKVNKTLQSYARITKVTILKEPLEMTTTKKVKRGAFLTKNVQ